MRPPWWAKNPHINTILSGLINLPTPAYENYRLELTDGDFIDLAFSYPSSTPNKVIALMITGLEGNKDSNYIKRMALKANEKGWIAVVHQHRGCSGEDNRHLKTYHSGEIQDISQTLQHLTRAFPQHKFVIIGYSLGGNQLGQYLSYSVHPQIRAAAIVCAPLDLASCSSALTQGAAKIYQKHLIDSLKIKAKNKLKKFPQAQINTQLDIDKITTFWEFDHHITAPLHGFKSAFDYYQRASAKPRLKYIKTPCLIIHNVDDPFMGKEVIPSKQELSHQCYYHKNQYGGHIGFICGGLPWRPEFSLEPQLMQFFQEQLALC